MPLSEESLFGTESFSSVWRSGLLLELELYDELALNMKYASEDLYTPIRWGGAWCLDTITGYQGLISDLQNYYIDMCREQGQRPQLDVQHFELTVA